MDLVWLINVITYPAVILYSLIQGIDFAGLMSSDLFAWVILPILIFLARIADVSIGTIRVIFISKGFKFIAPFLGFFEVAIWLLAIQQIMTNLNNIACFIAYPLGFAAGTFVGMYLEEKISIGKVLIRIITRRDSTELVKNLRDMGYNVTRIDADGTNGKVKDIFTIINRQDIRRVVGVIKHFNPKAFYSIEDVRFVSQDKVHIPGQRRKYRNLFGFYRKGK